MTPRVAEPRISRQLAAGILFTALGAAAFLYGLKYRPGDAMNMGPGYVPAVLSLTLAALGVAQIVRGLSAHDEPLAPVALRPALMVTLAALAFAFTVDRFGLVPAVMLVVLFGCLASSPLRWHETFAIMAVLTVVCALVFVYGLRLPFALF